MFRGAKTAGMMAGGGLLGGLGGQVSDALSAPRRALWNALGGPDTGAELLGNVGMDPNGIGASVLGPLVEMAGDPLSYAGAIGGLAGRLAPKAMGAMGLVGDAKGVGSIERFAQQGMQNPLFAEAGALGGVGGGAGAIGEAVPVTAGRAMPPGFSPSALPELQPNEISELLADMQLRTGSRNAGWDALAAQNPPPFLGQTPFTQQMAPPAAPPGTPVLPPSPGGPTTSLTAEQVRAGGLPPTSVPRTGGVDFMAPMQQYVNGQGALPPELEQMLASLSHTNVAPPQPPLPMGGGQPFALPPDMGPGAGLGQGYSPLATGGVPMPSGAPNYKLVGPDVQELLRQLGLLPEMQSLSRGGLPPWAQVRGGRVGMTPGVLPQDVLRGAGAAAGY